ncbi:hypothetical protein L204_103952 [Cryptococcus depauperatus]|nr:hypothetical protein L204_03106 [Cryptococcus depauperatus CBS 7855]
MRETYPGEAPSESSRTPRVCQLDADELDEALVSMLIERVSKALENFRSSSLWDLKLEVQLIIKFVIFRYGVLDPVVRSSPGASLQNLKLVSSPRSRLKSEHTKLLIYLCLHPSILPSYVFQRVKQHALSKQWPELPNHDRRKQAWNVLGRMELAAKLWEAAGWLCFLYDSRYPSLLLRILGLRLVPSQPHLARLVSYEFMNRQLVWNTFTEFLMFAVPLLPSAPASLRLSPLALLKSMNNLFSQPANIDYTSLPIIPPQARNQPIDSNTVQPHKGPLAHLPRHICPLCYIKRSNAPVPLSSTTQGSEIILPPISGLSEPMLGHDEAEDKVEVNRVFMPAKTDCNGGCQWCYYCIGEELYKHREKLRQKSVQNKEGQKEEIKLWTCLRCGGRASRAWRLGAELSSG